MTMSFWSALGKIGKAINPFSGIIGSAGSIATTAMTNAQNMKMMREQQAYNTKEREASQAYNTSERKASQVFQDQQRVAQNQYAEDIYNQYQSPAALVEQYQAAGLNPRLAIDGKSVGNISAASGSTGGAPSGSHIQPLGVTPPYMNAQGYASAFGNIAEGLKALGEAKKSGIDVQYMEQEYQETIKGMKLDNAAQELLNSVNTKYLDKEQQLKLLKFVQDLKNKKLEGERLMEVIKGLAKDNIIKDNEIDTWYETFDVNKAKTVSETNLNNASAGERSAAAVNHRAQANLANHQASYYDVLKSTEKCRQRLLNEQRFNVHENTAVQHYQNRILRLSYQIDSLANRVFVKNFDQYSKNEKQKLKNDYINLRAQYTKLRGEAVKVGADAGFDVNFNDYLNASWDALDESFGTMGKIFKVVL